MTTGAAMKRARRSHVWVAWQVLFHLLPYRASSDGRGSARTSRINHDDAMTVGCTAYRLAQPIYSKNRPVLEPFDPTKSAAGNYIGCLIEGTSMKTALITGNYRTRWLVPGRVTARQGLHGPRPDPAGQFLPYAAAGASVPVPALLPADRGPAPAG